MTTHSDPTRGARRFDRRAFLKGCGVLGLGALGGGLLQARYDVFRLRSGLIKVASTRTAMGTYVTITALDASRDRCDEAIGRAFDEIDRLAGLLSRHDPASPLAVLNRDGRLADAPPELVAVTRNALDVNGSTAGAFDATVLPIVRLFERTFRSGSDRPPSDAAIAEAVALIGSEHVQLDGRAIRFDRPGMALTLDGIAKGAIVDRASDVLAAGGVGRHLVNAGGDIRARGRTFSGQPWLVAVEDPHKTSWRPATIRLADGAVATSGSYEVFFDQEHIFHHIVDPHTGRSPRASASASVLAGTAERADALATATMVMQPEAAARWCAATARDACLLIDPAGHIVKSTNWDSLQA